MFCVDLRTAIISLYNINWLVFITETECLLHGTDWIFKYIRLIIISTGLDIHDRPQAMNNTVNISWNQRLLQYPCFFCASTVYGLHLRACTKCTPFVPLDRTKAHCSPFCSSPLQSTRCATNRHTTCTTLRLHLLSVKESVQLPTVTSMPVDAQTWHWSRYDTQITKLSTVTQKCKGKVKFTLEQATKPRGK